MVMVKQNQRYGSVSVEINNDSNSNINNYSSIYSNYVINICSINNTGSVNNNGSVNNSDSINDNNFCVNDN